MALAARAEPARPSDRQIEQLENESARLGHTALNPQWSEQHTFLGHCRWAAAAYRGGRKLASEDFERAGVPRT